MRLVGAVLAGGKSSRMGTDKALVRLERDGPTLLELVLTKLHEVVAEAFVIATDRPQYRSFGVPVEPDHHAEAAALGGIATALEVAGGAHCLVVPCDLPFLDVPLLRQLASRAAEADVVIPTVRGESRQGTGLVYQTLHAIYGPACLPPIHSQLQRGERQIVRFFDQVSVMAVAEDVVRRFDPELWSFFNVNTPDALAIARARVQASVGGSDVPTLGDVP